MEWRDTINRFLVACWEDGQATVRAENNEQRILTSLGTSKIQRKYADARHRHKQRQTLPLGSVDDYKLVQESTDDVIVEVDANPSGYPLFQSRFCVVREDGVWRLDDVYWACHCDDGGCFCCNDGECQNCSGGDCSFCDGKRSKKRWGFFTQSCVLCKGSGSCMLCDGSGVCDHCKGVGKCRSCSDSEMPGWTSIYCAPKVDHLA